MAGYVLLSYLSIAYTSATPKASAYHLYDAVVIPMCLYLLVRLVAPDEAALRTFVPAVHSAGRPRLWLSTKSRQA